MLFKGSMIIKIFKGVWFVSLMATLGIFLYVYASLPESVSIGGGESPQISRNGLFYITVGLLGLINVVAVLSARLFSKDSPYFIAWIYGLVILFNVFLTVALQFVNVSNSQERFDYKSIGYIIYASVTLVIIWSVAWPIYRMIQRFSSKQAV